MHKLEIKLKQHTPLIHFQHDQEGATLRASEVKPKLDKFIIRKLKESGEYNNGVREGWIKAKNGKDWLDYKMRIEADIKDKVNNLVFQTEQKIKNGELKWITYWTNEISFFKNGKEEIKQKKEENFPFLMANMGGKNTEEELMNFSFFEEVRISFAFTSSQKKLLDSIYVNICSFFALNNFGQRQDKGFGSFTVTKRKIDNAPEETVVWLNEHKRYYVNKTPLLEFLLSESGESIAKYNMLFSVLDFYWKCLKSGVNYTERTRPSEEGGDVGIKYPERYIKSFLWTYLNGKPDSRFTWEKREIKTRFSLETTSPRRSYVDNDRTAVFARGMMGCPDSYTYFVPQNIFDLKEDKGKGKYVERRKKFVISIENSKEHDSHDGIQRIPSPIIFKPVIENNVVRVYILFDEDVINKLANLPESERKFRFIKNGNRDNAIEISIAPGCIDFKDLVEQFHKQFFTNKDYISSLWGKYEKGQWAPAKIKEQFDPTTKKKIRICNDIDISEKMIPRTNKWKNILGQDSQGKDNFVSFSQIEK